MNEIVDNIKTTLLQALERDELRLPTLPEVALKVREAAENPEIDVASMARVLEQDAAVSARLIKVANSPLLRASKTIEDVKMAVSRLGITYTANLAVGLAMEQMFQATSDVVDQRLRESWQRSTEVAAISHTLARHCTKLKPDQATLAGLLHRIGALPILTFAEDQERRLLKAPKTLDYIIETLGPRIGSHILKSWDFPAEIACVPREAVHFKREIAEPDYADVVMVAMLQSLIGSDHPFTRMNWSTITAFNRLGLDAEVNLMEVEDLSGDMEAAMAALR